FIIPPARLILPDIHSYPKIVGGFDRLIPSQSVPETMLNLVWQKLRHWWSRAPWLTLSLLLFALYVAGFVMIRLAEPANNPIRTLPTYTYFFLVTITTVGYGDVVPVTVIGRMAAGMIAVGGIGAAAVALGNVFSTIGNLIKRREKGFAGFHMK